MLAAADEPIAGGRHKVFGHPDLAVLPQTSTIASHLPRAARRRLRHRAGPPARTSPVRWPADAVVRVQLRGRVASTTRRRRAPSTPPPTPRTSGLPLPLLFVCEDNGIGISVPHARTGWIERGLSRHRPTLRYLSGRRQRSGRGLRRRARGGRRAVRAERRPAVPAPAHRPVPAATPAPTSRRPTARAEEIARRPRRATRCSAPPGCSSRPAWSRADELVARYEASRAARCARWPSELLATSPSSPTAAEVMAPLAPRRPDRGRRSRRGRPDAPRERLRRHAARARAAAHARPAHQPRARRRPGRPPRGCSCSARTWRAKGGVYGVTRGAAEALRRRRGCSTRCSTSRPSSASRWAPACRGLLPIPEIQYLAYLHNAEDQLRGEAATLSFFSNGQYRNPHGRAHRRLRLPEGLRRPLPQRQRRRRAARHPRPGDRVARRARTTPPRCCAPAWRRPRVDGTVCVFLEPIALYHTTRPPRGRATAAGSRPTPPSRWAETTCPIGARARARRRHAT